MNNCQTVFPNHMLIYGIEVWCSLSLCVSVSVDFGCGNLTCKPNILGFSSLVKFEFYLF